MFLVRLSKHQYFVTKVNRASMPSSILRSTFWKILAALDMPKLRRVAQVEIIVCCLQSCSGNKREDIQDDWNTWRLVCLQVQSPETSFTAQHKTVTSGSYILFTGAPNIVEDMPWTINSILLHSIRLFHSDTKRSIRVKHAGIIQKWQKIERLARTSKHRSVVEDWLQNY